MADTADFLADDDAAPDRGADTERRPTPDARHAPSEDIADHARPGTAGELGGGDDTTDAAGEIGAAALALGIPGGVETDLTAGGDPGADGVGQQEIFDIAPGQAASREVKVPGVVHPVVTVLVETALAHLQRPLDYVLGEKTQQAQVGCQVEVRLGASTERAWVIARGSHTQVRQRLQPVRRLISPLPALAPEILALARELAQRHGVGEADVIRLAIPPRHARAEKAVLADYRPPSEAQPWGSEKVESTPPDGEHEEEPPDADVPVPARLAFSWQEYPAGAALLARLAAGGAPSCVWTPALGWAAEHTPRYLREMIALAMATLAGGRRVIMLVPTARHIEALQRAWEQFAPQVALAVLHSEDSSEARYRAFVRARLGMAQVIIGTRAALYAPAAQLGAIIIWDEANENYREPRSPGAPLIEVARLRARHSGGSGPAAVILGGLIHSPTALWLTRPQAGESGAWPHVSPGRAEMRRSLPLLAIHDEEAAKSEGPSGFGRIPSRAHHIIRTSLEHGPVLIQVPRSGYINLLACARCAEIARCPACGGAMRLQPVRTGATIAREPTPQCRWCGEIPTGYICPGCGGTRLKYLSIGSQRTAEELGKAFTGVPVLSSGARANAGVVATIDDKPRLVIATPGAEPWPERGYRASVILDAAVGAAIPGMDGQVEAARRWASAIGLTMEHRSGGQVLMVGEVPEVIASALLRGDSLAVAQAEIPDRLLLRFPPVTPVALIEGERSAVAAVSGFMQQVRPIETVGPIALGEPEQGEQVRLLVRIPRAEKLPAARAQLALAKAVRAARIRRAVEKIPGNLRIRINPPDLLS